MEAILMQFVPWLVGGLFTLLAIFGVYFSGKKTGKSEKQAELTTKTNEQATEAAKESRDVQTTIDRLPPGAAAGELLDKWVRKPPASRP